MNLWDILLLAALLLAVGLAARKVIVNRKKGGSCGCGCADCDGNCPSRRQTPGK